MAHYINDDMHFLSASVIAGASTPPRKGNTAYHPINTWATDGTCGPQQAIFYQTTTAARPKHVHDSVASQRHLSPIRSNRPTIDNAQPRWLDLLLLLVLREALAFPRWHGKQTKPLSVDNQEEQTMRIS
ncbi:hypothetical protein DACRYDRAFT_23101 [Dacryopinax primogenitus]|uniref:Uncharacterized protein n=1 Tax=Dacryopinax primogenitus (strain DJM 731) TaxID=1858805 RepID=M5FT55_DACPD|nr:uncharacterized protein DACRYDRAFT_23101 [Dacryopinax primogenitus]EJU00761.1 hypothetical protein DACRYDRAFT_23101 [Dacryopinax primogenitus]